MTAKQKIELTDKLTLDILKIDRIAKSVRVRISTEHCEEPVRYKTLKEGDTYTYVLKLENDFAA